MTDDFCLLGNLFGASNYRKERNAKRTMLSQEQTQNADQSQETTQTTQNVSLTFMCLMKKWLLRWLRARLNGFFFSLLAKILEFFVFCF